MSSPSGRSLAAAVLAGKADACLAGLAACVSVQVSPVPLARQPTTCTMAKFGIEAAAPFFTICSSSSASRSGFISARPAGNSFELRM